MARCSVCNKSVQFGHNVSHSHRKTGRVWKPNIKTVRVKSSDGRTQKIKVCTACLKSGKVERA